MSKFLKFRISEQLYNKFQAKCDKKNKTMSEILRNFSKYYTDSENVVLLDLDDKTLKEAIQLCNEKKVKFNELMRLLLQKSIKNKDKLNI